MTKQSLADYAAQHPMPEPAEPEIKETARSYREQLQERETADRLMESILTQLEQGNQPQYILYTAIKAIGLLAHDQEWADTGQRILDGIYSDTAQQSLITDTAAIEAQRLEEMQAEYADKMRQQIKRQLKGYKRIENHLQEALQAIDDLDGQP